jgi:long-subunit acyl-CoA synthetase (AMP-forming)
MQTITSESTSPGSKGTFATLCEAFQATAQAHPERSALRTLDDDLSLTWHEYAERVRHTAAALTSLGVGRGDVVGLLLTQRPEAAWVDAAAMHLGATTASFYVASAPAELEYVLSDSGSRVLVTERSLARRAAAVRHACPALEHVVSVDGGDEDGVVALQAVEAAGNAAFDFESSWRAVRPGDTVSILYTSGTTGPPKGVEHTHATTLAGLAAIDSASPSIRHIECLSFLPLAHLAERAAHWRAMMHGSTTTYCPDPTQLGVGLARVRPTWMFAPPRVWEKLRAGIGIATADDRPACAALAAARDRVRAEALGDAPGLPSPEHDQILARIRTRFGLDRLEHAITGGAPCAGQVLEFFHALGLPMAEMWGMTEIWAPTVTRPGPRDMGTVGVPTRGFEVGVDDVGEVVVRGPAVTPGYRNRPAQTAELIDTDGWVHTGDIGNLDADGRLRIVDRMKELIISTSGHNMSPSNIEATLKASSPLIGQACCIGDGRDYNVALIVLDADAARAYARTRGGADHSPAVLAFDRAVLAEVSAGVERANAHLSDRQRIVRHGVLRVDWPAGGDELTPTMKLRRKAILAKYSAEIECLYQGDAL